VENIMCLVSFSKEESYSSKNKFELWDKSTPIWAYIELTDYCSHQCSWCYGEFPSKDKKYISVEDFQNVVEKVVGMGIQQFSIGGGEPTEHPEFDKILEIISKYNFKSLHLLTHGDNLDAFKLKDAGFTGVHINYQGKKRHKHIHKTPYENQLIGIQNCKNADIDLTASITVGKYNLEDLDDILFEVDFLGFKRVRFWETTGVGTPFLKDADVHDLFDSCSKAAKKYGYVHSYSYEPHYDKTEIHVPCIQVSGLGMYIDYQGMLKFCGATEHDLFITDVLNNQPKEIIESYKEYNKQFSCNNCEARNPTKVPEVIVNFA
jgi:MoaA/NifB/PqqE/SkfB family radical SAM enzyme